MAQFIINLDSVSTENSKQDIMTYLESKPDYATWQDFYDSSAGQTLIELIAGLSAFISGNVIMGRREAYLPYAQTKSAHIGISGTLGYSVFRGANARIKVLITPTVTEVLPKYTIIGSVLDTNLILLEDAILSNGTPTELNCTLGDIETEEKNVASLDMQTFRFYNPSVSEDLRIFLNTTEVEYSNLIGDLSKDKYVVISNSFGAFDLYYLNNAAPTYDTGDILKAEYIKLNDINFDLADISVDYDGVTALEISDVYANPESNDSIKVNAPLHHETQGLIKGREDYPKLLTSLNSDFIDTKGHDFSPAVVEVSYIKTGLDLLNDSEKADINIELLQSRPFGVAPAIVIDPIRAGLLLDISIKLLTTTTDNVPEFINTIIASHEKKLGHILDADLIENSIEQASYVKTARVSVSAPIWTQDTLLHRREFNISTASSDYMYEVSSHIRLSDSIVPTWTDAVDEILEDNELTWKCIIDDRCFFDDWSADTNYEVGDIIAPVGLLNKYIVTKRKNLTDTTEPIWTNTIGDILLDNEVIWQCIEIQGSPSDWQASISYKIGDIILPTTANGKAYTVVSYRSKTSGTEPTWPTVVDETVIDGKVLWNTKEKVETLTTLDWNEYFIINKNLSISN